MTTKTPDNLKYTKEHEWVLLEGETATIGITDFAQSALGDIVFLEIPEVGTTITHGETFGVVESIKSVSDLYVPLSGEITDKNADLEGSPEQINAEPYGSWLIKVKLSNPEELNNLLSAADYENFCNNSH